MKKAFFIWIFSTLRLIASVYEYNFAPSFLHVNEEQPIVVCIPSYNNEKYCIDCLESVFSQNYQNFRVIYIDDASTDNTYDLVEEYIYSHGLEDKIILIQNEINKSMLPNHYLMAHLCEDHEIIVSLDGDDRFYHPNVLSRINSAYFDSEVWVTYGQFIEEGEVYPHKPYPLFKTKIQPHVIRKIPFMFMQPRTYYAGLFKQIPKEHFMVRGSFFQCSGDVAIMTFLIDLAREHTYFIPEILYVYNTANPINDHKKDRMWQLGIEKIIKQKPPLDPALSPY